MTPHPWGDGDSPYGTEGGASEVGCSSIRSPEANGSCQVELTRLHVTG